MASILDTYGIKEVADVTFYSLKDGKPDKPVYYFDTLKVSTIEQTSENTTAKGGKGNPDLISWDYGQEITLTIEDALFSAKSMAIMFGATISSDRTTMQFTRETKSADIEWNSSATTVAAAISKFSPTEDITIAGDSLSNVTGYTESGAITTTVGSVAYVTFTAPAKDVHEIVIKPNTFAGNYYIVGDTYARSQADGTDELFQFIIPNGKVNSEHTLTMEADGDPSTYEMTIKALKSAEDKSMLKLVKYNLGN